MTHPTPTRLFFAGTDTDVGKTYTAALAAAALHRQGRRVGVYKPVASGCRWDESSKALVADDAVVLWEAAGRPRSLDEVCPQRFAAPLAPPQAAKAEGKTVDARLLCEGAKSWLDDFDVLIIEGAGGLMSPLADGVLNVDLVKTLKSKLLIVAANRLGAIHQSLATCAAARQHGVQPSGLILCQPSERPDSSVPTNAADIARYIDVPVMGCVPFRANPSDVRFLETLAS